MGGCFCAVGVKVVVGRRDGWVVLVGVYFFWRSLWVEG